MTLAVSQNQSSMVAILAPATKMEVHSSCKSLSTAPDDSQAPLGRGAGDVGFRRARPPDMWERREATIVSSILADAAADWTLSPYIHVVPNGYYNPISDETVGRDHPDYELVEGLRTARLALSELSPARRRALAAGKWIATPGEDLARLHFLRYVSLEAHTVCNQRCNFCPVSVAPRAPQFMDWDLFTRIVDDLTGFRDTLRAVFLSNYNEPTADPRFVERVSLLKDAELAPAVLSNGTGLTAGVVDALVEIGGLAYLSVNLSTLDRQRYREERGRDHLPQVLRNLEALRDRPVAPRVDIVVLGDGGDAHEAQVDAIRERFQEPAFRVNAHEIMDRAGKMGRGRHPADPNAPLAGCENLGSRPFQHLHVVPDGRCVFCCQDYDATHVVGDLRLESIAAVLSGDALVRLRRLAYGVDTASESFMCRKCVFALRSSS